MTNVEANLDALKYSLDAKAFIHEVLGLDVEWFHGEWIDLFENNDYTCLLAPRGSGKSYMVGAYIIWRIVKDPDIRVLVVTINQKKADEMMYFIQTNLENNDKLKEIFGDQKGFSEWSKTNLRVLRSGRTGIPHKEPTLTVFGLTAGMVGGHYELILLDDITDRENSRLAPRREEVRFWYNNTLTNMLEPDGKLINIATKWHEDDISNYFSKKLPNFTYKVYKGILNEEEIEQGKKPKVLWPKRWPYKKLMERKKGMGSVAFYMQIQNEIVSAEDAIIKREWIENAIANYKLIPQPFKTYLGVDLASEGSDMDYFSITAIGIKDGSVYVLDGIRTRASLNRQLELIKSMDAKWKPSKIGIEQAAQQKIIIDQWTAITTLPIIPVKPSIVNDRHSRVDRLSVLFETNRIFINEYIEDYSNHLVDELAVFDRGSYDDCIDSLCYAIQSSQEMDGPNTDWNAVAEMIHTTKSKVSDNVPDVNRYKVYRV